MIFWTKFAQKKVFPVEKINRHYSIIEFSIFELVQLPNFTLIEQFWICQKRDFWSKMKKVNKMLIFWLKHSISGPKQEKWILQFSNFAIMQLCIFKLVLIQNSSLTWQYWFFGPNLPKKGYFLSKTEKVNTTMGFCIFKLV